MKPARPRLGGSVAALVYAAWMLATLAACQGDPTHDSAPASSAQLDSGLPDSGALGPTRPSFCEREGDDPIRDVFCADALPVIGSLEDLQDLFGLNPRPPDPDQPSDPFAPQFDPAFHAVALGHSTALPGHIVSPINPRLILIGGNVFMAYQRGVQRIELSTRTRDWSALVFYLVTFEQACNRAAHGCGPGDLYTPSVERDWIGFKIEDDADLANTPADCRQCHRRGSDSARLLMRELEAPWTHFFFPADQQGALPGDDGSDLMKDYLAAKGDERYGGLALADISGIGPFNLETIVGLEQPLLFDAPKIENERWPWTPAGYASEIHESPTWENAYAAFQRGEQLALPYLEVRATDPDKQAALGRAYQRYRAGELEANELPDLADIFPDDPSIRARIGLATEPDATPSEALIQACGPCHNDVLDQTLSRARFTIALSRLDRSELDRALDRLQRPHDSAGAMPPPEARQLPPETRARLIDYLRRDPTPDTIDPSLERAATLGMTGGGNIGQTTGSGFGL